jgi:hypothetical protein
MLIYNIINVINILIRYFIFLFIPSLWNLVCILCLQYIPVWNSHISSTQQLHVAGNYSHYIDNVALDLSLKSIAVHKS